MFYNYLDIPNGYSDAMMVLTKTLKTPFTKLRKQGLFLTYLLMNLICKEVLAVNVWRMCIKL